MQARRGERKELGGGGEGEQEGPEERKRFAERNSKRFKKHGQFMLKHPYRGNLGDRKRK